jgi:hypothetical protein
MWASVLVAFGAILHLKNFGAFASVICDRKHSPTTNSTDTTNKSFDYLKDVTEGCVTSICSPGRNKGRTKKQCGPVVLSVTYFDDPTSDSGRCIGLFNSLIEQCITKQGAQGGTSRTTDALYSIEEFHAAGGEGDNHPGIAKLHDRAANYILSVGEGISRFIGADNVDSEDIDVEHDDSSHQPRQVVNGIAKSATNGSS